MPLRTTADEWTNAEAYDRTRHSRILEFLRERSNRAFSPAEIATEVYDTSALVGAEAVAENHDSPEMAGDIVRVAEGAEQNANRFAAILHVTVALEFLLDDGLVDARYVPVSMVDSDGAEDENDDREVALYCYDGE